MSDSIIDVKVPERSSPSTGDDRRPERPVRHEFQDIRTTRRLNPLYSQMVLLTKFVLPIAALMLVLVVAAWPYLQKESIGGIIFATGGALGERFAPAMVNPRYTGVDKDNRPFAVTADLAHNVVKDASIVDLEMPKADITTEDGSWIVLAADTGVYNKKEKFLDLEGAVNVFHDLGYELNTRKLRVNIEDRTVESILPVQGQGPVGDIASEGFRLNNVTRVILFSGKARLLLYPGVMGDARQ